MSDLTASGGGRPDRFIYVLNAKAFETRNHWKKFHRSLTPDGLYGRERYWFNRMRHRTHDREARRLIHAYENGVRRCELEVVRDRRSPFGLFVVEAKA